MRIAYLEDDTDQAALIRRWLEAAGHVCHHFDRGHALQRSLAHESFDVFLLDWHLPDTDGLQVLKEIRACVPEESIIFVTARDRDDDVARVLQAGADGFIGKPVRKGELLARIEVAPFIVDRDATLSVAVSVNQANAANVTPAVYTDTIAVTLTP